LSVPGECVIGSRDSLAGSSVSPSSLNARLVWLAVPVGHYLGANVGVLFTAMPEGSAMLWPANSVLLTALLLRDGRGMFPLALLVLLAEVLADTPLFSLKEALLFGAINIGESLVAFALLRRAGFDPRFGTLDDLHKFLLAGPVVAALLSAIAGGAVYSHFRGYETSYLEFARVWWFGDGLGLLVFTPLFLGVAEAWGRIAERLRAIRTSDWTVLALAFAALAVFVATRDGTLFGMPATPALMLPFAIAVAARFGLAVSAGTAAAMSLAIVVKTTIGHKPFGAEEAHAAVLRAQEFVLALAVATIGLAALLAQLRARQHEADLANARLAEANERLEARVREKTEQYEALNRELRALASIDSLTGIANRRAFLEQAHKEFDNSLRYGTPLSLLVLDLDHFKRVNDRFGHEAGDRVLQQTAVAIVEMLRSGDLVARYGGEEFVVLAPHTGLHDAATLAARIKERISRRPLVYERRALHVTISIGVASRIDDDADLHALLRRADAALYDAKRAGRDRVALAGTAAAGSSAR